MADKITNAASERRKRFLESKKQSGGSAETLIERQKKLPWRLYFDDTGTIQCFTNQSDFQPNKEWLTYDFTQEQLEILKEKDHRKYMVVIDPKVDNLYHIQLRPLEDIYVPTSDDFLMEVESGRADAEYQILCQIKNNSLIVSMHDDIKKEYADVYPISATRNGARILRFYITEPQDPHVMYEYKTVSLADLLTNESVARKLGDDLAHCSIYTNKIFDKYLRT